MSPDLAAYGAVAAAAVAATGLFAGLETGIYTLNRVRLAVRAARGEPAAVRLRREVEHPNRTLSVLLIAENAASYVASFCLAQILHTLGLSDWTLIVVEALLLAPLFFVFAETLPKDLFRTHTDHWTYGLSAVLVAARWLLTACGLLPVVQASGVLVSRLLGAEPEGAIPARQAISRLIKEGVDLGVLSESQTTLADRALALRERTVATEMVPWHRVATVPDGAERMQREEIIVRQKFSRLPVVDASGRVVGIVSALDAMLQPGRSTQELASPALFFTAGTPLREAIAMMRRRRQQMSIVVDHSGGPPRGLVTFKDLVEPITGELGAW